MAEAAERKAVLDEDVDAILDEIDEVLETNAAEFVQAFVQKFMSEYKYKPDHNAMKGYTGMHAVKAVQDKVGKLDGALRALMSEMYIENLVLHTRRGLEGVIRDGRHAGGAPASRAVLRHRDHAGVQPASRRGVVRTTRRSFR